MGTLRIKRGTKTALQTNPGYTPAEGELVYTTDSKEVFVGDGATVGGTPVSVSTQNLEDLGNVQALAAQKDQILVYNGSNWAATDNPSLDLRGNIYGDDSTLLVDAINGQIVGPVNTTSVVSSGNIVGDLVGDVTGSVTGNVVGDSTGTHFGNVEGNVDGDLTGSIFAEDSTMMIDAISSLVVGDVKSSLVEGNTVTALTTTAIKPQINLTGEATYGELNFTRGDGTGDLRSGASNAYGQIKFFANDSNGNAYNVYVQGGNKGLKLFLLEDFATFDSNKSFIFQNDGKFGIGTQTPDEKVTVNDGNVKVGGQVMATSIKTDGGADSFIQFGTMTTTQRDALTAENGMVIYNSSANKFQGYENGSWVNLV